MLKHRSMLKRYRKSLLSYPNVVAAGIGYKIKDGKVTDQLSIVCSVSAKLKPSELKEKDLIPSNLEGVPTDVIQTGVFKALQSPTDKFRPAPGGVSIGHKDITAGTLGCVVKKNGSLVILSNNHVLANSNNALIGDSILQPGTYDGGTEATDKIATLQEYVTIEFTGLPSECNIGKTIAKILNWFAKLFGSSTRLIPVSIKAAGENLVDCAIAKPLDEKDVLTSILNIGEVKGMASGELGMEIQKSGRTTGYTKDSISQVDVTVSVQYGEGTIAVFTDQLMAGAMSAGGDSGSAVLDMNNNLVGLLFAGSDTTTIINRMENVFSALGLEL